MKTTNSVQNQQVILSTKLSTGGGVNPSNALVINTLRKLFCTFFVLMSMQLSAQIPPCTGTFAPTHYIPNNQLASTFGTTLFANTQVIIQGNYIVDANVIFRNSWVEIDPCAIITIKPGYSMVVDSSCLSGNDHLGTYYVIKRWNTIRIDSGAVLTVVNNSYISDADTAINSIKGGVFQIDESYLTNNWNGLRVSPYTGSHTGTSYFRNSHIIGSNSLAPACNGSATISNIGIHIVDNYSVTIGDATVNALTQSIENHYDGIYFTNSSVYVLGTIFDHIDLGSSSVNACIRGTSSGNGQYDANIGGVSPAPGTDCAFTNSPLGINVSGNFNFRVLNCQFNTIDYRGIWAHNFPATNWVVAFVRDCEFTDCVNGNTEIVVFFEDIPITGSSGIDISGNLFNNSGAYTDGLAISINQSSLISGAFCNLNEINDKEEGIRLENVEDAEVLSNTITGLTTNSGNIGIKIVGCIDPNIEENSIIGTLPSSGLSPTGIFIDAATQGANVYCNSIEEVGYNMQIENTAQRFYNIYGNYLNNGLRGINIKGANNGTSGDIGIMGSSPSTVSDNEWDGNFLSTSNRWIYTQDCDAVAGNTKFYCRLSVSGFDITGHSLTNSTAALVPTLSSYNNFDCSPYGARMGESAVSLIWHEADFFEGMPYYNEYQHAKSRYAYLNKHTDYWTALDSIFMISNSNSNIAKFSEINFAIFAKEYTQANNILNGIEPENDIETATIDFLNLLINHRSQEDFVLTQQDSAFLIDLSHECPLIYGDLVSFARAWMNITEELNYASCPDNNSEKKVNVADAINTFTVFPNPSLQDNHVTIAGNISSTASTIEISTINGSLLSQWKVESGTFSLLTELKAGVYIVKCIPETGLPQFKKLIVTK